MAPIKRKAVTDERPQKKAKSGKSDADSAKTGSKPAKPAKAPDADSNERRPLPKSILQEEERAFPRGGASVLTPIEHKQIKAQAERDVLLEHENGESAADGGEEGGDLFDDGKAAASKKKKNKKSSKTDKAKIPGSSIRIQGLSYKSLIVGSTVLGHVTAITGKDIALALPNNLTGYVPITAVSDGLNSRIEKLLAEEDENEKPEDEEDVDLKQLFHVGQWLRAVVTSTGTEPTENAKSKRHIELSVDPAQVNAGLDAENTMVNSMVQASVRSVEDHGIIMDLGFTDNTVKGFASKKELGAAYDLDQVQEGQVMMCLVTGKGSNGKTLKLSPDTARFSAQGADKNTPVVNEAPTVDAFLPGTAVNVLVTDAAPGGVAGKIMGMLDVTADIVHSEAGGKDVDLIKKYKIGSKVKGRIIFAVPKDDGSRRVGISLQSHLIALPPRSSKLPIAASAKQRKQAADLEQQLRISSIVEDAKVTRVLTDRGLFLVMPSASGKPEDARTAFAHISQISDNRIDSLDTLSGPYKLDSTHKVRVISYNPTDNVYYVSLKKSTLDQTYLRLEDLSVGEIVKGNVEKLILGGKSGITGILVKLSDGITGLVPETHMSDVQLQNPERKFREGFPVKARVLSIDLEKRHLRLTMKKLLVDAEGENCVWSNYSDLKPGMESKGTIINLLPAGAVVQFFGDVRAWLPVAEMSDTFIDKPEKHFRLGQTVNVRIVSLDASKQEMKVSCKESGDFDDEQQEAWGKINGGDIVTGTVTVKANDSVTVDLENGLRGLIPLGQLADGAVSKAESTLKRIRVGQKLTDLVVLNKLARSQHVLLTSKSSLVEAAKAGDLISSFEDLCEGQKVHGFVRNITPEGIYVEFANELVGLAPKSQIAPEMASQPSFGLKKYQTIHAWVISVDAGRERFTLSMREQKDNASSSKQQSSGAAAPVNNPVDASITSMSDFKTGRVTRARIVSTKATQVNIRLADNIQGRIDVSEMFDSWDAIKNKKAPLQAFKQDDVVEVKVLGMHDARNHRFLPISHRQGKTPVYELSAKKSRVEDGSEELLSMDTIEAGSAYLAFVNNHGDNCVWASLSPNVRGRIALMDLSDDVGVMQKLDKYFPIGSALRVTVKKVDPSTGKLDLSAKSISGESALTLKEISAGMILPGRITKINERSVNVQLTDDLAGPVPLVELGDDYDELNFGQYNKNDIVRVCVLDVDLPNKKVFLSLRPSKVLSSSLPVKDTQITSIDQLSAGQLVRGFVKHVANKGVLVSLGARVDGFVRVGDLSDKFAKDWQSLVEIDQLVQGRILSVDAASGHIYMSLKESHVDEHYTPPIAIGDLKVGMVVTGKVRKVEDFGAFIDIDNTHPRLSGLCHRSEVAAKRVEDVRTLYSAGDVVKAKILNVDVDARKISLGLKASYFEEDSDEEDEDDDGEDGVELDNSDEEMDDDEDDDGGIDLDNVQDMDSEHDDESASEMDVDDEEPAKATSGLKTSGFDWTGDSLNPNTDAGASDSEAEVSSTKKKKRSKPEIKVDMTGDLDKFGPRSVSDFERHLLSQPNDSGLWIQYMAFQLELSEIQKARDIAERALRTIHIRESEEKANIWIAWLNLEVEYGDEEKVDEVFKQACQVQDPLEMHEKLASIYIDSGKHDNADGVFEKMIGNKAFRASPDVWLNYATFLMESLKEPARARALLSRSLQSVPTNEHRLLTAKFAALEFRSTSGDAERGRTIFEGLISEWPKWATGWDMWVDIERARVNSVASAEAKRDAADKVRALYERIVGQKMKKRRAKFVFKRWLEFEESAGNEKTSERVKALARDFVEKLQAKGDDDMDEE
ncbi:Hypothetical protein R9X50_00225700 [Acrodontium crateriforme]|uniref:rRNA biogenesis protein RRP5 n=1 Tax=Acrodontium crateriforme TaxID=150365 RepID=A0AAQ3R6H4_9PEZI|nr:Hypothetical protein R9X50_00225700 [Acrodontium crateriforme]